MLFLQKSDLFSLEATFSDGSKIVYTTKFQLNNKISRFVQNQIL